jgi:hypothetical protein
MSSSEFIKEAAQNKTGRNIGKRSIWLNGKNTKGKREFIKPQFQKYVAKDFSRLLKENASNIDITLKN